MEKNLFFWFGVDKEKYIEATTSSIHSELMANALNPKYFMKVLVESNTLDHLRAMYFVQGMTTALKKIIRKSNAHKIW